MSGGVQRVAIVTGGGRGIGRASVLRLAQDGADVVVAEIGEFGADVVPEVEALGRRAEFVHTDVADRSSVENMVAHTLERFGRIDILVNSAGILGREVGFLGLEDEDWEHLLSINLMGVVYCCRAVLPQMLDQGYGRIVSISSGARRGADNVPHYGASKAAVVSLSNGIANSYARQGVLVNCVEPGRALTDMVVPRFDAEHLASPPGVPIGRYSSAEEVAEVVAFLCSERCTYTVGAVYRVSGAAG